jgi:hypothetical protein
MILNHKINKYCHKINRNNKMNYKINKYCHNINRNNKMDHKIKNKNKNY